MFAIRQIIEDPQEVIAVPLEFRIRRTEVIFLALDQEHDEAGIGRNPQRYGGSAFYPGIT
jgi:hypothetical protein